MRSKKLLSFFVVFIISTLALAHEDSQSDSESGFDEMGIVTDITQFACRRANATQLAEVNLGNAKGTRFFQYCSASTNGSPWCREVMRPNPSSASTFACTYGNSQLHQLINPDENTWPHAAQGVLLIKSLEALGIKVCQIYNWWRPEPYNANVGGAAGRHPFGTSIDVKFCSKADMEKGFAQLCKWRAQGRLRALGYYGTYSLHFGVGDRTANTWGKSCSRSLARN